MSRVEKLPIGSILISKIHQGVWKKESDEFLRCIRGCSSWQPGQTYAVDSEYEWPESKWLVLTFKAYYDKVSNEWDLQNIR